MTKRDQITRDYLGGMTVRELAVKYDRTPGGITSSLYQWRVSLSPEERARRRADACRRTLKPTAGRPSVWPDCPPDKLADYQTFTRYYGAHEARKMLEAA